MATNHDIVPDVKYVPQLWVNLVIGKALAGGFLRLETRACYCTSKGNIQDDLTVWQTKKGYVDGNWHGPSCCIHCNCSIRGTVVGSTSTFYTKCWVTLEKTQRSRLLLITVDPHRNMGDCDNCGIAKAKQANLKQRTRWQKQGSRAKNLTWYQLTKGELMVNQNFSYTRRLLRSRVELFFERRVTWGQNNGSRTWGTKMVLQLKYIRCANPCYKIPSLEAACKRKVLVFTWVHCSWNTSNKCKEWTQIHKCAAVRWTGAALPILMRMALGRMCARTANTTATWSSHQQNQCVFVLTVWGREAPYARTLRNLRK
jgi:hypothetical protein